MDIRYDDDITHCPFCAEEGAMVRLAVAHEPHARKSEKVCQFHGQITGRAFRDKPDAKLKVFRLEDGWHLIVPDAYLLREQHERGIYHRRTFGEIVKLMDFYISRRRVRQQRGLGLVKGVRCE